MFKVKEFTANGYCSIKEQGAPGKKLCVSASTEQKFRFFVAESENELTTHLEEMGFEIHRRNYRTQFRYNFITVCKVSEEEDAALGIFVNLERFEGKLPSLVCIEELGKAILTSFQKTKHFGDGSVRNALAMSLLTSALVGCMEQLNELDQICVKKKVIA